MVDFEEEYLDVLQNIEAIIVRIYHDNKELSDYDVDKALKTLIQSYRAEQQHQIFSKPQFSPLPEQVYEGVQQICEWRLGRVDIEFTEDPSFDKPEAITVEEIIACLKRIHKSVEKWNKRGGMRGYLQYIEQFII